MFEMLAASPVTRAVGLALLHFVWQGLLIAAAAALLLHALRCRSAATRYAVGCVALLAMATAPVITTMRALNEPATASMTTAAVPTIAGVIRADTGSGTVLTSSAPGVSRDAGPACALSSGVVHWLPAIVLAWAVGVLVLTINLAGAWTRSVRLRRTASPVEEPWRGQLDRVAERLGVIRQIALSQSALVDVPTLVGWIRPAIVVPASVLTGLTPSQLDAILTHELAHVRRHDYLVNLFQSAIETLLFYHPAVWWLSRRIRLERELCCDDLVIAVCADRVAYARALASLEELRMRRPLLGVAATGGNLLDRVRRILTPVEIDQSRSSAWSVVAAAIVVAPIALSGGVAENSTSPAPPAARADIALAPPEPPPEIIAVRAEPPAPAVSVQVQAPADATKDQAAVLAAEEQFRLAKLERDVPTLDRLLDDAVISTNQSGVKRNKAELLALWRTFQVEMLTVDSADVQITGDLATVTGRQSEISGTGSDPMLFTRIWRRVNGTWRLFSVTQFFDPSPNPREVQLTFTARPVRLEYEIYLNDALIGRRTFGFVNAQSWSLDIPGEPAIPVSALVAAGQDAVHVNLMGGAATNPRTALTLEGDGWQETAWTSGTKKYRLRIRNLATEASASPIVKVGGDIRRPELVKKVDPIYPQVAKDARVSGLVIIELVIDEVGNVIEAKVVRSVPMLDAAALDAVRQWRYTPPVDANGRPVRLVMSVNVTFAMQ